MGVNSEEIINFSKKMEQVLSLEKSWKNKDLWWFLSQLVKEVRLLDKALSTNSNTDIINKTASIATYAMIIYYIQKNKKKKTNT